MTTDPQPAGDPTQADYELASRIISAGINPTADNHRHSAKLLAEYRQSSASDELAAARERAEKAESLAKRLADDCLLVLSGAKVGTPEKGYAVEPWFLRGDLERLVEHRDYVSKLFAAEGAARDEVQQQLAAVTSERDDLQKAYDSLVSATASVGPATPETDRIADLEQFNRRLTERLREAENELTDIRQIVEPLRQK